MIYKLGNIKTIFIKLETVQEQNCICQDAMYLHRLYLNIEQSIETYFKESGKKLEKTASYHKDLLMGYFKSVGLETSDIFSIVDELRGFRHIFNKRADILEFIAENIEKLKIKILSMKEIIIKYFGEI